MPQIKIGETVQFTVGAFNSITRNPSSQAPGTWYYTVKGGVANGDKLQGTAHMLWAMLPVWPGAGGQMTITRTGPTDFTADTTAPGDGVPPKLEEYSAAGRSFSTILPAVVSAEEVPNEIDGTGPAVATGATRPPLRLQWLSIQPLLRQLRLPLTMPLTPRPVPVATTCKPWGILQSSA